jgi:hypothetical protein
MISSELLISGFGVRVPGGAPPLTSVNGRKKIAYRDLCPSNCPFALYAAVMARRKQPPKDLTGIRQRGGTYQIRALPGTTR